MSPRRVSIGPGEIAGYFSRLNSGFDELGIPCEHFVLTDNKFVYQESDYFLRKFFLKIVPLRKNQNVVAKNFGLCLEIIIRLFALFYAAIKCDVFIFSGFGSFLNFYELPLLRSLGKKIIVVYFGSDARPPYMSGRHLDDAGEYASTEAAFREAKKMSSKIRRVEKYATFIVNHTATAQFFKRPFVRFVAMGLPVKVDQFRCEGINDNVTAAVRIVHAPSRPKSKGTEVIRQAIAELRGDGYNIDFIELTNVPNSTVLNELQNCDFVIDELYSDVPMAMFATEAAMFSKPAIVGGYYASQFISDNVTEMMPVSLYVDPSDVKQTIKMLLDSKETRERLGADANKFVSTHWQEKAVAQKYLRLIQNDVAKDWVSDPLNLTYCFGWGLARENWLNLVGEYIEEMGEHALLLDHNPKLKHAVLEELCRGREKKHHDAAVC
jgi:glycosyltransferase involved in cell wall biosynthesis